MGTCYHGVPVRSGHVRKSPHTYVCPEISFHRGFPVTWLTPIHRRNMAPTMCVPGVNDLVAELHVTSPTLNTLAVTIYVLGMAIGPMIISPLSETYGRLPVYHASNVAFLAFVVGCALSRTIAQFMVFRFISGCMGGTPMALGGATIADVTRPEARSIAMALFSLGPLTGPVRVMANSPPFLAYLPMAGDVRGANPNRRFSAPSLGALLPVDWAGAGRAGCWPSSAAPSMSRPPCSCVRRTPRHSWNARQPTSEPLPGTLICDPR